MIITCPSCGKRFGVQDSLVPPTGRRARCAACGKVFVARPESAEKGSEPGADVHFKQVRRPGDGLAAGTTFAAPAAGFTRAQVENKTMIHPPEGPPIVVEGKTGASRSGGLAASGGSGVRTPATGPAEREPSAGETVALRREDFAKSAPGGELAGSDPGPGEPRQEGDRTVMMSTGDVDAAARAGAAPGAASPGASRWRVRDESGEERLCEKRELARMIRGGHLLPEDTLAREGSEAWVQAVEVREIAFYFQLRSEQLELDGARMSTGAATVAGLPACVAHTGRDAYWACRTCGRTFCGECVREKRFGNARVSCCPECGEPCAKLEAPRNVRQFWNDMPRVLLYPLAGWGTAMVIMYGLIHVASQIVPIFGFLLVALLLTYNMLIVAESARGRKRLPDWPDFISWWDIVGSGLKAVVVTLVSILPLILLNTLAAVAIFTSAGPSLTNKLIAAGPAIILGNLVLGLICLAYYPMAFGITSVFNTLAPIFNPMLVFKAIMRIAPDYLAVLAFFVITFVLEFVIIGFLSLIPLGGMIIGSFFVAYFSIVQMHVLGWTLYQADDRLDWEVQT